MCGFFKPQFLFGKRRQCLYHHSVPLFYFSSKTAYVPYLIPLFFLFIVFTVFRLIENNGIGGMDAFVYKMRFENADGPLIQSLILQSNEPLYGLLVWIVRNITSEFRCFLIIFYTIIFFIQIKLLSKINITGIVILAYLSIFFTSILLSFCLMRNVLSIFFALLAYIYLDKKDYKVSFLVITMAVLIHFSAVICYPVWVACYFFDKNKIKLRKIFSFFLFILLLCFFLRLILPTIFIMIDAKYAVYLNSTGLASSTFISRFFILLLAVWKWKKLIYHNQMNRIMFVVLLFNFLVLPLQAVLPIVYRMLSMADPAVFFLICELFAVCTLTKKNYVVNLFIRLSLIGYLLLNIFMFVSKSMPSYGLEYYSNILL
jgi:hypothetical protein